MAYFPFFVDLKNRKCTIFGGGEVACRKVKALLDFEADITVVAPYVCKELKELKDRIHILPRNYRKKDLEYSFLVIAATDDELVNSEISEVCKERQILVNVVDEPENCNFFFPAYVKRGDIAVGISTSGKSPVMAGRIKEDIQKSLPDYYEILVDTLGENREFIKNNIPTAGKRAAAFKELADIGITKDGVITAKDVETVIRKQKGDYNLTQDQDKEGKQ